MRWSIVLVAILVCTGGVALWFNWPKDCACLPLLEEDGVVTDAGVAASPDCLC